MVRTCLSKSRFFLFVCFFTSFTLSFACENVFRGFWPPYFFFLFFCVVLCFPTSDASLCVHNFLFLFVQLVPFDVRFFIYLPDVHHGTAKSRFEFFFVSKMHSVSFQMLYSPHINLTKRTLFFFYLRCQISFFRFVSPCFLILGFVIM